MASGTDTLDALINILFDYNLDNKALEFVEKDSGWFLRVIKQRLFNEGLSGDLVYLDTRVKDLDRYIYEKRRKGLRAKPVNLRKTGKWYDSLRVIPKSGLVYFESIGVEYDDKLSDQFGEGIHDPTVAEVIEWIDTRLEPEITKQLQGLIDGKLSDLINLNWTF